MKKKEERVVALLVREIGGLTRQRIRTLPDKHQPLAWASIAAAITAAGIHDSDPDMVIGLVQAAIDGMAPYIAEKKMENEQKAQMV